MLLLLLDADVIIDLHRLGVWHIIVQKHTISIPSIILHKEAYYYEDASGKIHPIELEKEIGKSIQEISCLPEELAEFTEQFDYNVRDSLHSGEKEALVLLQKKKELLLCTCDKAAIKALALLDLTNQGISVENLLNKSGVSKKLEPKHTEKYFKLWLTEGSIMKLQGSGFKKGKQ